MLNVISAKPLVLKYSIKRAKTSLSFGVMASDGHRARRFQVIAPQHLIYGTTNAKNLGKGPPTLSHHIPLITSLMIWIIGAPNFSLKRLIDQYLLI